MPYQYSNYCTICKPKCNAKFIFSFKQCIFFLCQRLCVKCKPHIIHNHQYRTGTVCVCEKCNQNNTIYWPVNLSSMNDHEKQRQQIHPWTKALQSRYNKVNTLSAIYTFTYEDLYNSTRLLNANNQSNLQKVIISTVKITQYPFQKQTIHKSAASI